MTKDEYVYFGWWSYWRMRGEAAKDEVEQFAIAKESETALLSLGIVNPINKVEHDISGYVIDGP